MKSLLAKIFMVIAAAFCFLQGIVLLAVGLGTLSSEKLMTIYGQLMAAPKALTAVFWVGGFFVLLGFILLVISSRTRPVPHVIEVEKDGKPLSIPERAVREFILQILSQNPCASDVNVAFEHKGKGKDVEIEISAALDGVTSIYEELAEIETVLKSELERVFEWKTFTVCFHLRGIGIDPKRKYFSKSVIATAPAAEAPAAEAEPKAESVENTTMAAAGTIVDEDTEDVAPEKPKNSSFLSKMLLGK
ncbi:MAG: hypothetical protein WCO69_00330 [Candidatus Omnitrophota bacterium]